jgi:hypothetical protein
VAQQAQQQELGVAGSRIIDFRVSPTRIAIGESVTISGILQGHTPVLCFWNPIANASVDIYADTTKLGTVTTDSGGGFRFVWTPRAVGVYWVKAVYGGDWWYNGCESPTVKVEVITQEQKRQEELQFYLTLGIIVAGVAGVVAAVLYHFEQERLLQLIMVRRR